MSFKPEEPLSREDVVFASELGWSAALASLITALAITIV